MYETSPEIIEEDEGGHKYATDGKESSQDITWTQTS